MRRIGRFFSLVRASVGLCLLLGAPPLVRGQNTQLLISPSQLRQRLETGEALRIVDLGRSREEYRSGHLPGAVYLDVSELAATRDGVPGMLAPPDEVVRALENAGVGTESEVILYDAIGGLWASRLFWILEYLGHEKVRILDGGIGGWRSHDGGLEEGNLRSAKAGFKPAVDGGRLVDLEWVRANLGREDLILVDARSRAEYTGSVARAAEGGHIPGAVHLDWQGNLDADGSFLPPKQLERRYLEQGVKPEATVVTYCQTGVRAAHDYFALRLLGYGDVRLYDGSWAEWGNNPDTPVRTGTAP